MSNTPQSARLATSIINVRGKMRILTDPLGKLTPNQSGHLMERFRVIATRIAAVINEVNSNLVKVIEEIANTVGNRVWEQTVTLIKHMIYDLGDVWRNLGAVGYFADPRNKEELEWSTIRANGGNGITYYKCQTDPLRGKDNSMWSADHAQVISLIDEMRETLQYVCAQLERISASSASEAGSE